MNAVRKEKRLRKKAKKSSTEYHWAAFRRCRAELNSFIKWQRKQYFKSVSSTITENPKRFLAYYQSKYKSKRFRSSVQHNGVKVYDAQEKLSFLTTTSFQYLRSTMVIRCTRTAFSVTLMAMLWVISQSLLLMWKKFWNSWKLTNLVDRTWYHLAYWNYISSPFCTLFTKQHGGGCFPKLWKVANLVSVFKSDVKES